LCVKGRFGYDFIYHKQRVTTPLVRRTPQKPGERTQAFDLAEWRPVAWDEALDLVADRLVEIYAGMDRRRWRFTSARRRRTRTITFCRSFSGRFSGPITSITAPGCATAGSVIALQQAIGSSAMSNTAAELINADAKRRPDVFIVTGSNTTENHPIIAQMMKAAVEKYGAKMIVVDPRRLELVNYAKLWLPLKPGSNVPVFSAMAKVIIEEGLVNQAFVTSVPKV